MLSVRGLTKSFEGVDVLRGVDADVNRGDVICVIGPSGSGKSTFLRCLNLLEKPSGGQIYFEGTELTGKKVDLDRHRQKMGMVFQQFNLFPHMTILENLTCAPMLLKKIPREQAEEKAMSLLSRVGLADRAGAYPAQLSGGQKQRVALARALATNPSVLLCDEPTSALDALTTQSVLALLKKINAELGVTIVIITHELGVVRSICNRMVVIDESRVVEQGDVAEIFAHPQSAIARQLILGGAIKEKEEG